MDLFFSLMLPFTMTILGLLFYFCYLKKRNALFGFRTKTSRSSQEAWNYSNKLFGLVSIILGLIFFILILTIYIFLIDKKGFADGVGGDLNYIFMIFFIASFFINLSTKRKFNK